MGGIGRRLGGQKPAKGEGGSSCAERDPVIINLLRLCTGNMGSMAGEFVPRFFSHATTKVDHSDTNVDNFGSYSYYGGLYKTLHPVMVETDL